MSDDTSRGSGGATSRHLLERAQRGDSRAISQLFRRHSLSLRQWARGRLPHWARAVNDTADLVQDVLLNTFRRLERFEDRGRGALRAYLRQAVIYRINDEMRRIARHPTTELEEQVFELAGNGPSPFVTVADAEQDGQYKKALTSLSRDDQLLIVGRLELGYTYEQLALISGRSTPEAARVAVRRAITKLAEHMPHV